MPIPARTSIGLLATTLALGLVSPATAGAATLDPASAVRSSTVTDPVTINLLALGDFRGRISPSLTPQLATTIEQLRAAGGEATTLLLSSGDNIGNTLFASDSAHDQPTLDVLDALDLTASTVGNHELDHGYDHLASLAEGGQPYLAANVRHADGTPALPEYSVVDVGGVAVGIIGVTTQQAPELVPPAGIAGLTFEDPVAAVNRVAGQLTDGDPLNGEADVVVADYHDGAPAGDPEGATLASNTVASSLFSRIVAQTAPEVDAILTGHTSKRYAYAAPVPGGGGATRPVLQPGSFGAYVGQVALTYDPSTDSVTQSSQRNMARGTTTDTSFPRVAQVKAITDAAEAAAAQLGSAPLGTITAPITTAYSGGTFVDGRYTSGTRDDRRQESALGDLVANVLRDEVPLLNPGLPRTDLGIVTPAMLRAELLYAGNTASNAQNTDGVVTTSEANSLLPFDSGIFLVHLTGAALKDVLEQQYQLDANGNVPVRPYLQLGLSDNVQVRTDPTRPTGSRITSVLLDGAPLDPAHTYTVATYDYVAAGGDNFRAFTRGSMADTGLVDRTLLHHYLARRPGLAPSFARRQVTASGLPATLTAGTTTQFTLSQLDLTSSGSPGNTELTARVGNTLLGTWPVVNGTAAVELSVPDTYTADGQVVLTASPSGTQVTVPFEGTQAPQATSTVSGDAEPFAYGTAGSVDVAVGPVDGTATPSGTVTLAGTDGAIDTATLDHGTATLTIPAGSLEPGDRTLDLTYAGDASFAASSSTVGVSVTQARPVVEATTTATALALGSGQATVHVSVGAEGFVPAGDVEITGPSGTVLGTGTLEDGAVDVTVGPFTSAGVRTLTATYAGDTRATTGSDTATVTVARAAASVVGTASAPRVTVHAQSSDVHVTVGAQGGVVPTGTVQLWCDGVLRGQATLVDGSATLSSGRFPRVRAYDLDLVYLGDADTTPARGQVRVTTTRQVPTVTVLAPRTTTQGTRTRVVVRVGAPSTVVTGRVTISYRGRTTTRVLTSGRAVLSLKRLRATGPFTVRALYRGNPTEAVARGTARVRVVRR